MNAPRPITVPDELMPALCAWVARNGYRLRAVPTDGNGNPKPAHPTETGHNQSTHP